MRATNRLIYLVITPLILFSCNRKISDIDINHEIPVFVLKQTEFTDQELLNATYSDYKSPSDFYKEDLGDTSLYYVNTLSIDSTAEGKSIQLATNSYEKALAWSKESTYDNSSFTDGQESEKFFEFIRISNPNDNLVIKFRTHKASYLTRDNYDFFNPSGTIGIFRKKNFTADDAKELIDYLWFVRNDNNMSSKILSSFTDDTDSFTMIHHYELFIVYGDFNLYDEITMLENIYSIEKSTGVITVSKIIDRTIKGKSINTFP